jgi:hypothetical protein
VGEAHRQTWVWKKYDPDKLDLLAIDRALRKLRKSPSGIQRDRSEWFEDGTIRRWQRDNPGAAIWENR